MGTEARHATENALTNRRELAIIKQIGPPRPSDPHRGVAQLVARDVWDVDAAGSNPVTPTKITDLTAFCGQIGTKLICHRRQNAVVFNCRIRCPSELGLLCCNSRGSIFYYRRQI